MKNLRPALLALQLVALPLATLAQTPPSTGGGNKNEAAAEDDALSLQAEPDQPAAASGTAGTASPAAPAAATSTLKLYAEAAVGRVSQRYGLPTLDTRRLSLDYSQSWQPATGWRLSLSNRLDSLHPVDSGERSTVNSLREAYASWQDAGGAWVLEAGRINLRNGPAYGFNPTDYLREDALRTVTTADPLALRENRLGTVMLRAQRLWTGGALSLALAPKLADAASDDSFSLDLGATNRRRKALLSWSQSWGERFSTQALAYGEDGRAPQLGANATWLLSDAAVAHGEWSRGSETDRLAQALGLPAERRSRDRAAAGLTYTTASRLALTLEYQHNGAAPDRAAWDAAAALAGSGGLGGYLLDVQRRQDSASRSAWLVYASQKSLLWKNLDLAGFVRINGEDHSRFTWLEARWHFDRVDLAAQWLDSRGRSHSEYGVIPNRRSLQLLAAVYF
ncbi:MAG: hypothetical protein KBC73_02205 [Burkholderiaceae bacterium]|nr:hypothetical protein [Burkholderiaceae bacterium]